MPDQIIPITTGRAGSSANLIPRESIIPVVDRYLGACRRSGSCLSVLSISVDNLEAVRLRHGSAAENEILQSVWSRLRGRLRASDIAVHAEEADFAAVLLDASTAAAAVVDSRMTAVLCAPYCIGTMEIGLLVRTGVAVYPQMGTTGEELVNAAMRARCEREARSGPASRRAS